jgi:AraC-like DNA-binding protein
MADLDASLDKRCVLGATTRMDVAGHGQHEAPFHVLLRGTCELQVGATRLPLRAGDVVVIPGGAPHRIVTAGPGRARGVLDTPGDAFVTTHSERGGDPTIDLFCGRYLFGAGAGAMLFRTLPDPLHVSFDGSEDDDVLRMLSALMRGEAQREGDGTATILSALCVVLLAMMLRTSRGATTATRLWTAPTDRRIAAAIEAILDEPGADWSIDRISREAAMSRATFLRRFAQDTGMTPGTFVTKARLMHAAEQLIGSDATVASIALGVGYRSESAFSRAFRAEADMTPARFRRHQWQLRKTDGLSLFGPST